MNTQETDEIRPGLAVVCKSSPRAWPIGQRASALGTPHPVRAQQKRRNRVSAALLLAGVSALLAGCVERRVVYVPTYQPVPAYAPPAAHSYPPQTAYPPAGAAATAPQPATPAPPATTAVPAPSPQVAPQPPGTVVGQAPPPQQVEVVPVAPGPDYVWAPGYWTWNGTWVWIGGGWVIRPHPGAVWIGGHWGRRGRGYVWIGGGWR